MGQRKKRKKQSRQQRESRTRGGSMMSMRSGFKRLAGSDRSKKPRDRGNQFLVWLIVIVFVIILVMWMIR